MKKILSYIIDIVVITFFIFAFVVIHDNALGLLNIKNIITDDSVSESNLLSLSIIVLFVLSVYFTVSIFNKRGTLGRMLTATNSSGFFLSLSALVIDGSIIFSITLLCDFILRHWFYTDFFRLLFIVTFLYCFIASINKGRTVGKYYLGIRINTTKQNIFVREIVYKYGAVILLPIVIGLLFNINSAYAIFLNIVTCVGFTVLLFYCTTRKTWWNILSKSTKQIVPAGKARMIVCYFVLLITWLGSYNYIRYENNKVQNNTNNIFGIDYPFLYPEYPSNKTLEPYVHFLGKQTLSPKEYVLSLFDKYDIVILSETLHDESTQWELFSDIVGDTSFINKAGVVFTEYGAAGNQTVIDDFLTTDFKNDTLLEKATATLLHYFNGGFYYFVKDLNRLNSQLADSLKVRLYFTDTYHFSYIGSANSWGNELKRVPDANRDSLMANIVIDWYNYQTAHNKKKKCLVITNYRHAFGYAGGVQQMKDNPKFRQLTSGNEGQYIFEAFPAVTATVVQNAPLNFSKTFFFPLFQPINKGIWDKAFLSTANTPVGFDSKNSPFGADYFDMYPTNGSSLKLKYQDFFTGIIFNKPYFDLKMIDYPYKRYATEFEYRNNKGKFQYDEYVRALDFYTNDKVSDDNFDGMSYAIGFINFVGILFFIMINFVAFCIATYHLLKILI